jgi:hypothetical protein
MGKIQHEHLLSIKTVNGDCILTNQPTPLPLLKLISSEVPETLSVMVTVTGAWTSSNLSLANRQATRGPDVRRTEAAWAMGAKMARRATKAKRMNDIVREDIV